MVQILVNSSKKYDSEFFEKTLIFKITLRFKTVLF